MHARWPYFSRKIIYDMSKIQIASIKDNRSYNFPRFSSWHCVCDSSRCIVPDRRLYCLGKLIRGDDHPEPVQRPNSTDQIHYLCVDYLGSDCPVSNLNWTVVSTTEI